MTYAVGLLAVALGVSGASAQSLTVEFSQSTEGSVSTEDRAVIREIALASYHDVRRLLPELAGPVKLSVAAGPDVIPETGDAAAALAPGHVLWMVDPADPRGVSGTARDQLRVALYHELHHLARGYVMEGSETPISLLDSVVSEGLATAFSRDFAGDRPPWGTYPDDVGDWVGELLTLPADAQYREWMFQHPDGRRWIGYRAGTHIADRAMTASGRSAADLVSESTEEILRLAGFQPPS